MKKRLATLLLCLAMVLSTLTGCGSKPETTGATTGDATNTNTDTNTPTTAAVTTAPETGGILNTVEGFAYATLDPHKDYNSWHSTKYGLTESLFKLGDDMQI